MSRWSGLWSAFSLRASCGDPPRHDLRRAAASLVGGVQNSRENSLTFAGAKASGHSGYILDMIMLISRLERQQLDINSVTVPAALPLVGYTALLACTLGDHSVSAVPSGE
jgi:hypothetical protein